MAPLVGQPKDYMVMPCPLVSLQSESRFKWQSALRCRSRLLGRLQMALLVRLPNWSDFPKFPCRVMWHLWWQCAPLGVEFGTTEDNRSRRQQLPGKIADINRDGHWNNSCMWQFVFCHLKEVQVNHENRSYQKCLIRNSITNYYLHQIQRDLESSFGFHNLVLGGMDRYIWPFNHSIA